MDKRKFVIFIIFCSSFLLTIRLYCGVFEHDEFGQDEYFIKHRPTWKWRFYSPIGMSDLDTSKLTAQQKDEQKNFDEFVASKIKR